MSLFSPKSTILQLIKEAEEFTVTPDMEMQNDSSGVDIGDVTSELASSQPPAPAPQTPGSIPIAAIPQPQNNVPTTMTKTVANADAIRTQLTELKSVIITYEKKFEDTDLSPESSKVAVGSLLNVLIYHATELQKFLSMDQPTAATVGPPETASVPPATPETSVMPPMDSEMPEPTPNSEAPVSGDTV